jgi:magnesium-transporting ATPase (P-type)
MCFDKTGTLTQEGLDMHGLRFTVPKMYPFAIDSEVKTPSQSQLRFSDLYRSVNHIISGSPTVSSTTWNFTSQSTGSNSPTFVSPSSAIPLADSSTFSPALKNPSEYHHHGSHGSLSTSQTSLSEDPRFRRPSEASSVRLVTVAGHPNGSEQDFPYPMIICAMATCHSIKIVNGSLLGDPMDLNMFAFTGWQIEEGGSQVGGGNLSQSAGQTTTTKSSSLSQSQNMNGIISMIVRPPGDDNFASVINESVAASNLETDNLPQSPTNITTTTNSNNQPKLSLTQQPSSSKIFTELGVVRTFDFVSRLRRMSVVVRRLRYCREGAGGDTISALSELIPETPSAIFAAYDAGSARTSSSSAADSPNMSATASMAGLGVHGGSFFGSPTSGNRWAGSGIGGVSAGSSRGFEVFVKGAPEVMRSICVPWSSKLFSTLLNCFLFLNCKVPPEYDSLLKTYAHRGYRVIALAWRRLENVSWIRMMRMRREDVEVDLEFLGFIIFENKLKEGTAPIVRQLNSAKIRQVMCTGNLSFPPYLSFICFTCFEYCDI